MGIKLAAEDQTGKTFEVVVKFRGPELSIKSQIAELAAAPLADLLGIDEQICGLVQRSDRRFINPSPGGVAGRP